MPLHLCSKFRHWTLRKTRPSTFAWVWTSDTKKNGMELIFIANSGVYLILFSLRYRIKLVLKNKAFGGWCGVEVGVIHFLPNSLKVCGNMGVEIYLHLLVSLNAKLGNRRAVIWGNRIIAGGGLILPQQIQKPQISTFIRGRDLHKYRKNIHICVFQQGFSWEKHAKQCKMNWTDFCEKTLF